MAKYVLHKLLQLLPTLFGISLFAFILIRLVPGDPVMVLLGERGADPATYAEMNRNLGLDKPLLQQYFIYITNAMKGDLGTSIISKQPVLKEFMDRFPATLELGMLAMFWAILFGIPFGVIAAAKRNSPLDYSFMGISLVGYSMPIFWWGLILIIIFSVQLGITPVSGRMSVIYDVTPITGLMLIDTWLRGEGWSAFSNALSHMILPSIAMGTIPMAVIARMTRSSMLEVLGEDYIRTAKSKGLSEKVIVVKHALRNALVPIITVIGLMFGSLITGAILTETIFSWPGIGKWIVASVTSRDYPVIQGGILLIGTMIVILNIIVDLSYGLVNPRIRDQHSGALK
jgi:dipeptide transport system permease protein